MKWGSSSEEPHFNGVWQEALVYQRVDEPFRHRLVVLAGVADIGEDLSECLLVVDLHEVTVLFEFFFIFIIGIDVSARVVVVGFLVDETLQGQAVGERWLLIGPANGKRGHGHHEFWQLQDVDDLLRLVNGRTKVTVAESLLVHEVAKRLCVKQSIGSSIDKRQVIVVARLCLAAFCPETGAVEVSADGQYHGCLFHHRLVKMSGRQTGLHLLGTGNDNTVELQVAHRLGAGCLVQQAVQQFFADFAVRILSDRSSGVDGFHLLLILWAQR